jgi:hypothetical protein
VPVASLTPASWRPRTHKQTGDPTPAGSRRPTVLRRARRTAGRGPRPNGEPSASDFLLIDLPSIADTFTEQFEQLPTMYRDRKDYRFLVTTGRLVAAARRPTRGRRVDRLVQRRDRSSLTGSSPRPESRNLAIAARMSGFEMSPLKTTRSMNHGVEACQRPAPTRSSRRPSTAAARDALQSCRRC